MRKLQKEVQKNRKTEKHTPPGVATQKEDVILLKYLKGLKRLTFIRLIGIIIL